MADKIGLTISVNGIQQSLNAMASRAGLAQGWLNRVAYPMIIEAQRMRWASEGSSEGESWAPLNESYALRKLKKYESYPGGGRKMLIATGHLVDSVTGDKREDHYKLVEGNRLEVGTLVDYAKYVDEKRNFTILGQATIDLLSEKLGAYISQGDQ